MHFQRGQVVWSRAGHDKGSFFIVLSTDGEFAYIADGRGRTIASPKKKKLIHLGGTHTVLEEQMLCSDSSIRKAADAFNHKALRALPGGNDIV